MKIISTIKQVKEYLDKRKTKKIIKKNMIRRKFNRITTKVKRISKNIPMTAEVEFESISKFMPFTRMKKNSIF